MTKIITFFILTISITACNTLNSNLANLKSQHAEDRVEAIIWLNENKKSETTKRLLKEALTKDKSPLVRSLAARLMALSKNKNYLPLIRKALNDPHFLVRMEAAQSLGSLRDLASENLLAKKLQKDEHNWVRLKILKSISYMDANSKKTKLSLIKVLADQDPAIQLQAMVILRRFTGKDFGIDAKAWEKWFKSKYPNTDVEKL